MQKAEASTEEGVLGEHFKMRGPQGRRADRSMMDCPPVIINPRYMLHLQEKANVALVSKSKGQSKSCLRIYLIIYIYAQV